MNKHGVISSLCQESRFVKHNDIINYSQTCLCGHLYLGITCLKQPPFLGPFNQNKSANEPVLRGHLS